MVAKITSLKFGSTTRRVAKIVLSKIVRFICGTRSISHCGLMTKLKSMMATGVISSLTSSGIRKGLVSLRKLQAQVVMYAAFASSSINL